MIGFILIALGGILLVVGGFQLAEEMARERMADEMEAWDAELDQWHQELLEQRRRDFGAQIRSKEV